MGCSLFSNSNFQMGVTAMGFAEDFGLCPSSKSLAKMPLCLLYYMMDNLVKFWSEPIKN